MSRFTHALALELGALLMAIAMSSPVSAQAAAGHAQVQPRQHFTASINGSTGRPDPVAIRMACFGPILPGQTGHPMKGQTVAVTRVHHANGAGYTGDRGTSIGAFFGAPPPDPSATPSYVRFTSYGTKPIPTTLVLPCAGSGTVSFVPLPLAPGSRDFTVPVTFVGQP